MFVKTLELNEKPNDRAEQEIKPDDFSWRVSPVESPIKKTKQKRFRAGFIKLSGVQRHIERNACEGVSIWILESYRPRQVTFLAPAATGGETA